MTARATARASRARGLRTSLTVIAAVIAGCAAPARAEVGATVSAFSDLRFRGYSLSDGRPVAIVDFAYDDRSGLYADAAATGLLRPRGGPGALSLQLTGGYARRLASGNTLDFGITHSTYSYSRRADRASSYTEIYAGIARGGFSSRLFLSPRDFEGRRWTAYGELNQTVSPARRLSIDGHVGLLLPLHSAADESYRSEVDWRLGVSREVGRVSLRVAYSGGAFGHDSYPGRRHDRTALVLGASLIL